MKLCELIDQNRTIITTEFLPPRKAGLPVLEQNIRRVRGYVNAINLPELKARPPSDYRMNAIFAASRIKKLFGVETIFHLTLRDHNKNGIHSLLLAAIEAGLENVLVISGDSHHGDELQVSGNVYDYKSVSELISSIKSFGYDLCVAVGADPTTIYDRSKKRAEAEIQALLNKQDAGADVVQTQPVFGNEFLEFIDLAREAGVRIPFLVGVIPVFNYDDACLLERRFRISIPADYKKRLKHHGYVHALASARKTTEEIVKTGLPGVHIYPRENPQYAIAVAAGIVENFGSNLGQTTIETFGS